MRSGKVWVWISTIIENFLSEMRIEHTVRAHKVGPDRVVCLFRIPQRPPFCKEGIYLSPRAWLCRTSTFSS